MMMAIEASVISLSLVAQMARLPAAASLRLGGLGPGWPAGAGLVGPCQHILASG
jgi:hypothetical protein